MSAVLGGVTALDMLGFGYYYYLSWDLFFINSVSVEMSVLLDWMSLMFLSFVSFISSSVLYYSGGYMRSDQNMTRFMYIVLFFVLSMVMLIISPNLISILLGWDGLGLVSYALVIYYNNEKSAAAGMLTALSNRVGDVAILLSIALVSGLGGWNFIFYIDETSFKVAAGFLVLASMTKSAQIPFSAWLPAAMAAPTPVSALVHSSTLVTAGVYLMIRFSPTLFSTFSNKVLLLLGCLTMFMAGLGANFESDLKKIIALSTLSQLGVMMSILALGYPDLAFLHLLAHALFKALLFMCAGVVIHSVGDSQDIRSMGGLVKSMPLSVMMMNLSNLSLCGFPFLSGFYSKDLVLEVAFSSSLNELCFWLYAISTGLTVSYTFRLIYFSLSGEFKMSSTSAIGDEDLLMTRPMFGLALGAICFGCILCWVVFPSPYLINLPLFVKMTPLLVSLMGAIIGYFMNFLFLSASAGLIRFYQLTNFSGSMWFLPFLSTLGYTPKILKMGDLVHQGCDMGWLEYFGGQGGYKTLIGASLKLQTIQDNNIKVYMVMLLFWTLGVFVLFNLPIF
uniref:NADH dehydrogenase subunit 5 n=1 Tax=Anchistus australis TaxID=1296376 RepID=UPI0013E909AB|nr:NADH dehydrogenase subunit 5 [Anchistus australis]QHR79567.1 NADH dehydrogenase subunit 5 [Anchistus australis]